MRKARRGGVRAAASVAAACLLALALAGSARAAGIGFETPAVVDPTHTFGEPDVGVDPLGRVFVSGPTGTGTQRSVWFGSVDAGHTFRPISPGPAPSGIQSFNAPPGGGDTDIAFDRGAKQYFSDLYALVCLRSATTSDGGATASQSVFPAGCAGLPGADRQWLTVYDPPPGTPNESAYVGPRPLIYQEYNNISNGAQWVKSSAANDTSPGGPGLDYVNAQQDGPSLTSAPLGADGHPAIDQVTGKVFQAAGVKNATDDYSLLLNIGTPNAAGDLKFLDPGGDKAGLIHIADHLKGDPDVLFTAVSMDTGRNLHAVWAVDDPTSDQSAPARRQVYVSAASAASGWKTWTRPVQVSDGSPATGDAVNLFPWIQAGGPGRSDSVFYGADKLINPSAKAGQAWNVFMAQVVFPVGANGGITGAAPSVDLERVSPHPMHYQDVCLEGSACITSQGNRNLADFFVVGTDASGAAEVVYDDTSNGLAQPGFTPGNTELVDHSGAPVVTLARQSSGTGLYGKPVSGPSNAPTPGLADPAGDARYPVIGGANVPGFDLLGDNVTVSGGKLHVAIRAADLAHAAQTAGAVPGTRFLQYVTRWQMGNTIYYAEVEVPSGGGQPAFSAGKAGSVDLCSVSACFPHVVTYPESGLGGSAETGRIACPASPSASAPCTATIDVAAKDVGSPTADSFLEELGTYAFAAPSQQGSLTNAQAAADSVPLEIDGICCHNVGATPAAGGASGSAGPACPVSTIFTRVNVRPRRHGLRIDFARRGSEPVDVDVFQTSHGRSVIHERLVARFRRRSHGFTWPGAANRPKRHVTDGSYFVRLTVHRNGRRDVRRVTFQRSRAAFHRRPAFYKRQTCTTISSYKLERPVFGGRSGGPLRIAFRVAVHARATVTLFRGKHAVRRFHAIDARANHTYRLSAPARGRPIGDYRVVLDAKPSQGRRAKATLVSRRI